MIINPRTKVFLVPMTGVLAWIGDFFLDPVFKVRVPILYEILSIALVLIAWECFFRSSFLSIIDGIKKRVAKKADILA